MTGIRLHDRFYLQFDCPECGEEILLNCATALTKDGIPVIPADMVAQVQMECDCGAQLYTGDVDVWVEK